MGVEPICTVLSGHGVKIAPSTYYATLTRAASARAVATPSCCPRSCGCTPTTELGRGLYGARKVWHQLSGGHRRCRAARWRG